MNEPGKTKKISFEKPVVRLMHVVNGFGIGGAELKLLELVRLIHERYSNRIVQTICSVGQGGVLHEAFEQIGVSAFVFSKRFAFDFRQVQRVASLMRQEKTQIVQTTLFYADVIGTMAGILARVPIRISWETVSHENNVFHHPIQRRIGYRWAAKKMDRIVSVSSDVRRSLIQWRRIPAQKIDLIPYGVDLKKYKQNRPDCLKALNLERNWPVIGTVGRLESYKGHPLLIQAIRRIAYDFPDMACIFVGDGPDRERLLSLAEKAGVGDRIRFLGFRKDIPELLGVMDLFVLCSYTEGLPNALLEAMAASLPIIASAVGGIPEVIQGGVTGLLVPPGDVEALSRALALLLRNPERMERMGRQARKFIQEHYSLETQLNGFIRLYDTLLSEKLGLETSDILHNKPGYGEDL